MSGAVAVALALAHWSDTARHSAPPPAVLLSAKSVPLVRGSTVRVMSLNLEISELVIEASWLEPPKALLRIIPLRMFVLKITPLLLPAPLPLFQKMLSSSVTDPLLPNHRPHTWAPLPLAPFPTNVHLVIWSKFPLATWWSPSRPLFA